MPRKRSYIKPGQKLELDLTPAERKTILENLTLLPPEYEAMLKKVHPEQPLLLTLDDLEDFSGYVAAESNHTTNKKLGKVLDSAFEKMTALLDKFTDEKPPAKKKPAKKTHTKSKTSTKPITIYQFKITLLGTNPKIWRRIQIPDCKLNTLHYHIQAVMGWENSHLHHFDIKGVRHGIPEHLDLEGDGGIIDSKKIRVSQLVPEDGKKIAFRYTYDFGDNWEHEVLFEGIMKPSPETTYPACVEGERACPPENCGGPYGYEHMLEVLADPKHEEHRDLLEWVSEDFDPELFDARIATIRMVRGLRG